MCLALNGRFPLPVFQIIEFYSCFVPQYKATDFVAAGEGKLELVYSPVNGDQVRMEVYDFKDGGGVGMAMYNTDKVKN